MTRIIKGPSAGGAFSGLHADLTDVSADQHHAQSHTLTSHSTRAHSELTGVGATDHHSNANDHASTNDPTANQKAALAGTGTPSGTDKYVNDSDSRMTNARTPSAHASTHAAAQSDAVTITHAQTTGQTADDHHAQSHTLTSHSTRAHSELTSIGATDHHVAPAAGPDADITVDVAGAAGTASTFARSGHGHKVISGVTSATVVAGNDARLSDARTPTAHAATHIGSTTGEGSAAVIGTDPTTLISYVVRELIVEDEPFVLDSGKVCIVGSDNTALLWLDSGAQDVRSLVTLVQYQIYLRDEPFVLGPNELCVLGDASGRASIWVDANQMWDRTGNGFSAVTELNADNLFVIASGDVWEVQADSPIMRHRDPVLVDSAILWIQ